MPSRPTISADDAGGTVADRSGARAPGWRGAVGLRTALSVLVASTVACTALVIHLSWSWTAQQNVSEIVDQLNAQISGSLRRDVAGLVDSTLSVKETARSVFGHGALATLEPEKRAVLLLALSRAQPDVSWVAIGLPDGGFIGARKHGKTSVDLVEVDRATPPVLRITHYAVTADGLSLGTSESRPTDYDARAEAWFRDAVERPEVTWSQLPRLPDSERNAITTSTALLVDGRLVGVVTVAIEVDRLSRFLTGIQIGRTGSAAILDPSGYVVAAQDETTIRLQEGSETPSIDALAARDKMFGVSAGYLARKQLGVTDIAEPIRAKVEEPDGRSYFVALTPLGFQGWILATVIPTDDFLARIDRNSRLLLGGLAVLTLVIAASALYAAHRLLGKPLSRITDQLRHIESFELERIVRVPSLLREVDNFSTALMQMARGLASFRKYIPAEVVRTLVGRGIEARPGGTRQTLTIMFTDLVGFTGLSERLMEGVVPVLSRYLEDTCAVVVSQGGTIDKFIGDAVMAFWGAPTPRAAHAAEACAAALGAIRLLEASGTGLEMRIGINTGEVIVGNIGSSDRLSYTVIGDPVNVASRLEAINKRYGTRIIIGETTRAAAGDAVVVRRLDRIAVSGRAGGTLVFELLGLAGTALPDWVSDYEAGLEAYEQRRWVEAIERFEKAIGGRGTDRPSEIMIERCRHLIAEPPPADWHPGIAYKEK